MEVMKVEKKKEEIIKGYKAFDKDFKCRGFQFEEGNEYEEEDAIICEKGFHFCENPLDCLNYYPLAGSRFAEVEGKGIIVGHNKDSKKSTTSLRIATELSLSGFINAGVKFILDHVKSEEAATNTGDRSAATNTGYQSAATNTGYRSVATNTGYRSAATNTGNYSAATNTGYQSAATNTGNYSAAEASGKDSIACGLGYYCKARGALGCWLVLAERDDEGKIITVKSVKIDGKTIKADTWYKLVNGEFAEV